MQGERVLRRARGVGERAELCTAACDDGASVPMGGVRSSEGVRPLEGEARALEMVGRRARARGAGRSGVRSAWYHLQAERAVGRCAQQCEGRRAPAGGGEPSSALGIASEKTRAARAARAGRAEPGCAQAGGSSPSVARSALRGRPREESIIHISTRGTMDSKHKTFTPRTHQASFTSHQHANKGLPPLYRAPPSPPKRPSTTRDADGHTSTARSRRKSPRHRSNLKGRKSDSQLYGHHI